MGLNTGYRNQLLTEQSSDPVAYPQKKRMGHRLGTQSKQIERFLAQQRLPVSVKGGSVRNQWTEFNLSSQVGEAFSRLNQMKDELVAMLGVKDIRLARRNGNLRMRLRRVSAHPVDLLDLMTVQSGVARPMATLGLNEEGHQVALDLTVADSGNILIAGVEGAGKSSLLRSMAVSLALTSRQSAVQMVVIAPSEGGRERTSRRRVLFPMNYLPHLLFPVATSYNEAAEAIEYLAEETIFRAEERLVDPLLIVLIDDVDKILAKGDERLRESLAELLDAPKEAGIRIIMSAADVTSPELLRLVKFNMPLRLVGRMADANRSFLISGEPDTGAENLNGSGDFLAVSYASVTRFQAAYIDDYDLHLTLTEMHRPRRTVLLAQRLNPPEIAEDDILRFTIDEQSGEALLENRAAQTNQRPTEEAAEVIEFFEQAPADMTEQEESIDEAFDESSRDETLIPETTHSPLVISNDDLKNNSVLNSPSWKAAEQVVPAQKAQSRSPALVILDQDGITQTNSSDEEPEYDRYDDDWPLTGWDEEDSRHAKHLH